MFTVKSEAIPHHSRPGGSLPYLIASDYRLISERDHRVPLNAETGAREGPGDVARRSLWCCQGRESWRDFHMVLQLVPHS